MEQQRQICLISVPHTGTIFCVYLFVGRGYDNLGLNHPPVSRKCVYHGHMLKPTQVGFALEWVRKGLPLVMPLRHPYRVEEAWRRRGKDVGEMIRGFRTMMDRFVPLDPYVMPVDSEARYGCLEAMRAGLGVDFQTDWTPRHVFLHTHGLTQFSPSREVEGLVGEMGPFLARFYGAA